MMRYYGCWAGNPSGTLEDPLLCVVEVSGPNVFDKGYQCSRKRVVGDRCKQHAKKKFNFYVPTDRCNLMSEAKKPAKEARR